MAATKYIAQRPPNGSLLVYLNGELVRVQYSIDSIINLLQVLEVPVQIGPADSAGVGYRALRIPN